MFIHRLYNGKHFSTRKKNKVRIKFTAIPLPVVREGRLCSVQQKSKAVFTAFFKLVHAIELHIFSTQNIPATIFRHLRSSWKHLQQTQTYHHTFFFHNFLSCCLRLWLPGWCVDLFNVGEDGCVILAGGVFGAHTVLAGVFAYHVADFKVGEPVMAGGLALFRGGILGDVVFVAWVVLDAVVQMSPGDFGLRVGLDTALQENVVSVFGVLHLVDARRLEFGGQGTDAAAPFCWRRIRVRKKTFIYIFLSLFSKQLS